MYNHLVPIQKWVSLSLAIFVVVNIHITTQVASPCPQISLKRFGIPATARASFGMYNTKEDVDYLVHAVKEVIRMFK